MSVSCKFIVWLATQRSTSDAELVPYFTYAESNVDKLKFCSLEHWLIRHIRLLDSKFNSSNGHLIYWEACRITNIAMKTITNKMQEKYNTCFYHPCFSLSLNLQGSPGSLFILIITKEKTLMCRNSVNSFSHMHFLGCLRWNAYEIFKRNFSISNWFLKSRLFLIAIKC